MHRFLGLLLASFLSVAMIGCKPTPGVAFAELDYPVATETMRVGDTEIAYADIGDGDRTLLLVHGLGSYLPVWRHNLPALAAAGYRVVAIDLPGYGKSDKGRHAYSMAFFASTVRAVARRLEIERPVLVGHSMGGQIAMTYALRWPDEVEALVLTSPAGLETFDDGEAKWLANAVTPEFTRGATPEAIYVRHVQNFHRMPEDAHFMIEDRVAVIGGPDFEGYCTAVSKSVAAMLDEPVWDDIPKLQLPVLVLFGKHDELIPNPFLHGGSTERLARREVERFPDAELVVIERAGHMAQYEQSHDWNEAVLTFLRRLPPPNPVPVPAPVPDPTPPAPTQPEAPVPEPAITPEPTELPAPAEEPPPP